MLIDFLGDSITEGAGASSQDKCFVERVGQILGCKVINHGIGGTRLAHQKKRSVDPRYDLDFCYRLKDLDRSADLVFVFGGTNDFGHGDAPIGTKEDTSPDTFYGAVNFLAESLLKMFSKDKITFILPLHRLDENDIFGDGTKEKPSLTLEGYRNIMMEVLDKYGITYLDFASNFGSGEGNPLFEDGLHPSDLGHDLLARLVVDYIQNK